MKKELARRVLPLVLVLALILSMSVQTTIVYAAGIDHKITYTNASAASVILHWGINGWQSVKDTQMTAKGGGVFEAVVNVAEGTTIDYCYHITSPSDYWDNNGGKDWHTVVQGIAPTVSLTSPANNTTITGTINITANATDNVGVTKVEFYKGSEKIGEDTTSPYSISWNSSSTANGAYNLTAKAYDAANNIGVSSAVSITVDNIAPAGLTVHLKKPSDWNTNVRIHYWNLTPSSVPTSGSWPGKLMTQEGNNWYAYTIAGASSTSIVFNDSNGKQTADLFVNQPEAWYYNGTWHSSNPERPQIPVITASPASGTFASSISVVLSGSNSDDRIYYTTDGTTPTTASTLYSTPINISSSKTIKAFGINKLNETGQTASFQYTIDPNSGTNKKDFREETIYFVMTTRFYDGDPSNNVHCWDDAQAGNPASDPAWRGDFKGLIEKLDYIKALGFTAIWITPVVKNASGYDYHGYHAINFKEVDPRYESPGATYQDLINAAHAKGLKVIQDIVLNHTSNFGEENIFPMFKKDPTKPDTVNNLIKITDKLPSNYDTMTPAAQYGARIGLMKTETTNNNIYHTEKSLSWESYTVQTGQIAGDCVDLNTEEPAVINYLIDAYNKYIDMGVDGFRIDTVKHISRYVFNRYFVPAFMQKGGSDFFLFGEVCSRYRNVWNSGIPAISAPFYTWKESKAYPGDTQFTYAANKASVEQNWADNSTTAGQSESSNHYLSGNNYRQLDYSKRSPLNVIDFPMHWAFKTAAEAFAMNYGDKYYSDATWNVTYVDSHDYAPDGAPENQRFAMDQSTWAENLSLMYSFRGIPCIYYGSEIEFKKGAPIDVGPNAPLSTTGRAYFGDHITGNVNVQDFGVYTNATGEMANTLNHPLAQHIRRLNLIRHKIPALQKGQYSLDNIQGGMAFKRRFTDTANNIDSFALVTISGNATFNNIPNGTYVDAVTGDTKTVTNGTLTASCSGKGNMRIYVLSLAGNPAPGKIGVNGSYLK